MPPSSWSQSAATTALAGGTCELFRVKFLREIPHWWILGRCAPPTIIYRAASFFGSRKERKKIDNPREGWEDDGTPPPHRDFKERGVMR